MIQKLYTKLWQSFFHLFSGTTGKQVFKIKVLIVDDFLMQNITVEESAFLMDIIDEKQQTGSIIITTHYPINQWHKKLPTQRSLMLYATG